MAAQKLRRLFARQSAGFVPQGEARPGQRPAKRKAFRARGGATSASGLNHVTIAALLVVVGLPIAMIVLQAVFPEIAAGRLGTPFAALGPVLQDPRLPQLVWNTLKLAAGVVLLSAAIGVPLGVLRGWFRVPMAPLWDLLMLAPFLIPPYIAAMGWILFLQPAGYWQQMTGWHAGNFLFSFAGVVFVMTLNVFPVVYFAVSRGVASAGGRLADVARVCGAPPWQALWRVTLPLAAPAMAASLLLAFAMSIEEYGTPAVLAANAGFFVLVTGIESRLSEWPVDLPGAAVMSLILVALALTVFSLQRRLLRGRDFETIGGKPAAVAERELGVWRWPVLMAFAAVAVLATLAPLFAIGATAFSRTLSGGLTIGNLGLDHFRAIFTQGSAALRAFGLSIGLGLAAALLAGILGAAVAYVASRPTQRGGRWLDALSALPNTLPGVVVAVGLILLWNQPFLPFTPYNTVVILLLAYVCLLLPYPVRYSQAALRQVAGNLEAAARVHGAGVYRALWRIVLPLVWPSVLAAMVLVFAVASRELVASLLLAPAGLQTVSVFVWRQFEQGSVGQGMAVSLLTILATGGLILAALDGLRRLQRN
ncbi:MAG: ABC transporter permease [Pigmentiphaga sp.]